MLTPRQVENWRNVLYLSIGPYAQFMPKWQIEVIVQNLQGYIDREESTMQRQKAELARVAKERAARKAKEEERNNRLTVLATRITNALE